MFKEIRRLFTVYRVNSGEHVGFQCNQAFTKDII